MPLGRFARRPASGDRMPAGINITPLVDVMLVLVVIFILAAPLMTTSLPLQLPRAAAPADAQATQALQLEIDAAGRMALDGEAVTLEALEARLRAAAVARQANALQLRADSNVPYGRVAQAMAAAQRAGLARMAFVTEQP